MNLPKRTKGVWKKKIISRLLATECEKKKILKYLPREEWKNFEKLFEIFSKKTRAGKLLNNCFDSSGTPTPIGKRMKRFLKDYTNGTIHTYTQVQDFLIKTDDNSLKTLFGRKFLNVGKNDRKITGYNVFMMENGFENASRLWNLLEISEKDKYVSKASTMSREKKPKAKKKNLWQEAIKVYHQENTTTQHSFSPIRKNTEEYDQIKSIYNTLKSQINNESEERLV